MNLFRYLAACLVLPTFVMAAVSCGSGKPSGKTEARPTEETVPGQGLPSNFYKRLEGTVAGQPVVMYLHCYNGTLDGSYYYVKQGKPIDLSGALDKDQPGKMQLKEMANDSEADAALPQLDGVWEDGTFKGSWQSADKTKNYIIDLKEAYPQGSYTFSTLALRDSVIAVPGKSGSPEATVTREVLLPLQADHAWLSAQIARLVMDSSFHGADIAVAARQSARAFLDEYRSEINDLDHNDIEAATLNYEDYLHLSVVYNENGLLAIGKNFYGYTGGAHGYGGTIYACFDVENRKKLELGDVIAADSAHLQPVVEAAFRRQYKLSESDSLNGILFENHLATTNNFFITPAGLGFLYLQYEVASYAAGPIYVFVPYTSLKQYLQPGFARRMRLQ